MSELGRVESADSGLRWRVIFPDVEHMGATSYLRELAASDCSPLTVRSYAFDLLRWFRFLHERLINWERAERVDVRAFAEHLRAAPIHRSESPHLDAIPDQAFIERRRQLRPSEEAKVADDEWADFEEHLLLRRVALGECHRPYGTPCVHEHACT